MKLTKIAPFFLAALLSAALFTSCKETTLTGDNALTSIPDDATTITSIDVERLMEKADFEQVRQMEFYQDMLAEVERKDPTLAKVLADPATSGVDLSKRAYLSTFLNPDNPEENFTALVVNLSDQAAFEQLVTQAAKGATVENGDGFQYLQPERKMIVAWDGEKAVIGGTASYMNVREQAARIFNTTEDRSVAKSADLQKALAERHDLTNWISSNGLANNPQAQFAMGMVQIDPEALKDNYIHSYVDFETGEIAGKSTYFLQKALTKDLDKLFNDQAKTDFYDYVPGKDLLFIFTNALNIKGVDEVLSARPQSRGFAEFALKEYGLTIEDVTATFGGDLMVAGYYTEGASRGSGLFATNILDREKLNVFLDLFQEYKVIEPAGENLYNVTKLGGALVGNAFTVSSGDGFAKMLVTDQLLFISGDEQLLATIQQGGFPKAERINKDLQQMMSSNIFAGYFGLQNLQKVEDDLSTFQIEDVKVSTNRQEADLKVRMLDQKTNALKALFEAMNQEHLRKHAEVN